MDAHQEEQHFQEKIDQEVKIEPRDWMPDAYRKTLVSATATMWVFNKRLIWVLRCFFWSIKISSRMKTC